LWQKVFENDAFCGIMHETAAEQKESRSPEAPADIVILFILMNYEKSQFNCPVEATLFLIGGKYKPLILWHLIDKPLHYMELQRLIPKATPKMLSQQLHDLEECGMIHREVIPEKPPKTLYSLTAFGRSIIPVLDSMCNWGTAFLDGLDITPPCNSK
jgi:DNA-binding HxlR family transcriptional regulator